MRKLRLAEEALPALRKAAKSPDAEIRLRATRLIEDWSEKLTKEELKNLLARCKNGEVDRFIMQMARTKEAVNDEHWQGVIDLAEAVLKKSGFKAENHSIPYREMMKYSAKTRELHPGVLVVASRLVTDKVNIQAHILNAAVVCDGPVNTGTHIVNGILLANGDTQIGSHVVGGLIICDGNVEIRSHVIDSVIVARGTVRIGSHNRNSIIIQNETKPLGMLRFFDSAEIGIELDQAQGKMRVKSAQVGKAFAQAGIQKDDMLVAINDIKVSNAESCRRELRHRYWEEKEVILSLRRAGKPLEISVKLPN